MLSKEKITKERVHKFARRARAYTCAYYCLHYNGDDKNTESQQGEKILPAQMEKPVKDFKTHRCALDFEGKFIIKKEEISK